MAFAVEPRRLGAGIAAVALTAVLLWFGTGLTPWWPLLWLAPLPLLLFAVEAPWWGAALAAAIAWFVGSLNLWHYLHGALDVQAAILARVYGSETLVFAAMVGDHRMPCRRQRAVLRRPFVGLQSTLFSVKFTSGDVATNLPVATS